MGEIIAFPNRQGGCSRWQAGSAAITLAARPACAALAKALARPARDTGSGADRSGPVLIRFAPLR